MSHLSKLKIVPASVKRAASPEELRRGKLLTKLDEQLRIIEAELGGAPYERKKRVWITDDNGERKRIERPARLKPWWSRDATGNLVLSVMYGSRPIELLKGKSAIDVGSAEKLPAVLKTLKEAVAAGELDTEVGIAAKERQPKRKSKSG